MIRDSHTHSPKTYTLIFSLKLPLGFWPTEQTAIFSESDLLGTSSTSCLKTACTNVSNDIDMPKVQNKLTIAPNAGHLGQFPHQLLIVGPLFRPCWSAPSDFGNIGSCRHSGRRPLLFPGFLSSVSSGSRIQIGKSSPNVGGCCRLIRARWQTQTGKDQLNVTLNGQLKSRFYLTRDTYLHILNIYHFPVSKTVFSRPFSVCWASFMILTRQLREAIHFF